MPLRLTGPDRALLQGEGGPGAKMAMSILVRMAEVYGAQCLLDITSAHIDSTIYVGEASLEFAERLASLGARVAVPSTSNVSGVDEEQWSEWQVPERWARNAIRQMDAYRAMGVTATWTCAPYQVGFRPGFGEQVAWGESNAIAFANSVLGAKTERYPDLLDICCAITGRVPAVGLHLAENRAGQVLFRLVGVPLAVQRHDAFYPVLGYLLGRWSLAGNPVVAGLETVPEEDQLKALCAAAASSGDVGLLHLVGITPEAPDVGAACQGREPVRVVDITMGDLQRARRELSTGGSPASGASGTSLGSARLPAEPDRHSLDAVVVGCPHFSLAELARLAGLVSGRMLHPKVQFLVNTSRQIQELARKAGHLAPVQAFGARLVVDTCPLASPVLPSGVGLIMTDSGKHAYYAPGLLGARVAFGTMADCVRSAVAGRVIREVESWSE